LLVVVERVTLGVVAAVEAIALPLGSRYQQALL
jgi:hypothetical protein